MNTRARCRFKLTVTTGRFAVRNLQALNRRRELAGKSWLSIPGPSLDSGGNEHHAAEAESLERSVRFENNALAANRSASKGKT
jgi:hypothetical protein